MQMPSRATHAVQTGANHVVGKIVRGNQHVSGMMSVGSDFICGYMLDRLNIHQLEIFCFAEISVAKVYNGCLLVDALKGNKATSCTITYS